jgi:hypothetical protein
VAVPTLLYSSEIGVLNQEDYNSVTAAEMVKGCTRLDCFHNEDVRQELNVTRMITNRLIDTGNVRENVY